MLIHIRSKNMRKIIVILFILIFSLLTFASFTFESSYNSFGESELEELVISTPQTFARKIAEPVPCFSSNIFLNESHLNRTSFLFCSIEICKYGIYILYSTLLI